MRLHRFHDGRCRCGAREYDDDGNELAEGPCPERVRFIVAVYELDEMWGGPEEGGWWYTAGELCRIMLATSNEARAWAAARRINRTLAWRRENGHGPRYGLHSMAYEGGHYAAEVHENRAPEFFPEQRPHYE